MVFSTFYGGNRDEGGTALAVDAAGSAYLTGYTSSLDLPTVNPLQPGYGGIGDALVAKFAADGSAVLYATYLGGSQSDVGYGIAVDPAGRAHVIGSTIARNFPTVNPLQAAHGGGDFDAFFAQVSASGSALTFSTYLGGARYDEGRAVAVDGQGNAYVTGLTDSVNFPTVNPIQSGNGGGACGFSPGPCRDAFTARVSGLGSPPPVAYYYVYPDSGTVTAGVPFDIYVFALDAQFNVIPDCTGAIAFYATDPLATTPVYYQFQLTDQGIAYFPGGVTLRTPGVQALYVFDWPGVQVFGYAAFDVRP